MLGAKRGGAIVILFLGAFSGALCFAQSADFYVAKNGNNQWSGILPAPNPAHTDGPFATITRAQQAVRQILQNPQGRTTPVVVMLRKGTYFESKPLSFRAADSGTSQLQVVWQNYPQERPVISGGKSLSGWTNAGGNKWQITLPAGTQNFEQLFYNGQRRLRPRLGSSGTNLGVYYRIAATVYLDAPAPPNPPPDPNCTAYVSASGWECFDRFRYSSTDPITDTWQNLAPPPGNPCNKTAGNANLAGDIEVIDFEYWTVPKLRINCVDTSNQIIYLTGPTSRLNPPAHGFIAGHRYVIENVRDQLQQAGQWFLDRSVSPWVLTYLANPGEDPNIDTVVIPQAPQVLLASGLQYVTFHRLTFQNDNFVVPAAGYQSLHGDPNVTTAVSCQNCRHVVFDADVVTQTSGGGIEFISCVSGLSPPWCVTKATSARTANNTIKNSAIFDVGGMGVRVGLAPSPKDTDDNVPQFTTVQNTVIEGIGRVFPSSFGIAQGSGHDNVYTHNDIYDGYHSAIGICQYGCPPGKTNSRGAFNNTISFNHVHDLMQGIMDDTGAIYMNTGVPSFVASGNKILNNRIHDVTDARVMDAQGYGGYGVLLDADTGQVDVENNLVYRTTDRLVFQTCGPQLPDSANTIKNNILAFSQPTLQGVSCVPPAPGILQFNFTNNIVFYSSPAKIQYGCAYCMQGNCPATQNYASNLYCDISSPSCSLSATAFRTTDSSCSVFTFLSLSSWQGLGEDLGSKAGNPLFTAPFYPADNFTLDTGSPAGQVGFVPFNINAAGRIGKTFDAPAIAATFVTASMVANTSITLTSSQKSATYGQPLNLTAAVGSTIGPPPDGAQIVFDDSGNSLGTSALSQGVATLPVSGLTAGEHHITARLAATGFWPATSSLPFLQTISKADTQTTVTANPNPSSFGEPVTLTSTITSAGGTPTGTVEFRAGSVPLGTIALADGSAQLTTATLRPGTSSLTALYQGDANFHSGVSIAVNQTVNAASTTTTIASSPNPSSFGQTVILKATVNSPTTTPTGQVRFESGSTPLGSVALSNGIATLTTTSLKVGTDSITATYAGNNDALGSVSAVLDQVVNPAATSIALSAQPNPAQADQLVTLTATVTSSTEGVIPTGRVSFVSGTKSLGKVELKAGVATLQATFAAGAYVIKAEYSGTTNFLASSGKLHLTAN